MRILWVSSRIFISYFSLSLLRPLLSRETHLRFLLERHHKNAALFLKTALSLKGLMIKVGQFMSARIDLLPQAYTQTLAALQDEVPPAPFSDIRKRIIEELGESPETLFRSFNPVPLASASLGQVHEAILKTPIEGASTRVAVKVQYPNIEEIVETDLRAIRLVVWGLHRIFAHIQFDVLYNEFSRIVRRELNYVTEGKSAQKFHRQFAEDDRFVVPKVLWSYTTERVLTLERVDGIKINRMVEIKQAGIAPKAVAQLLVESYMKQILVFRFFHGDPHPGNLFIQPAKGGGGLKLVFVDFGMMQEIDEKTDRGMRKMILAIINRDVPAIAHALIDLGFIAKGGGAGYLGEIEQVVQFFMDRYRDISPHAFKRISVTDIAEDLSKIFTIYPSLQVPNLFILAGRAVGMLNGLCSQLDPDLNIIEMAQPYARKFASKQGMLDEIIGKGKEVFRTLFALPDAIESFLDLAHRGGVKTQMHSEVLEATLRKLYTLAHRTLLGVLLCGAILYLRLVAPPLDFNRLEVLFVGAVMGYATIALLISFIKGNK